jgi:anti-sigma B factor antagonist
MQINREIRGEMLALTLGDSRLDAAAALPFKEALRRAVAGHEGRVILDMGPIDFLDSSGLGALVGAHKLLGAGRQLELARCGSMVTKVLRLTRMDEVFTIHDVLPSDGAGQDAA